jgi:hypothetical protein
MGLFSKEEPKTVELRTGAALTCRVCEFDRFFERKGQLNTAVASFFGLDWTNATAECWVCGRCGYIHWFLG